MCNFMNDLTNLILFKMEGSDNQLNLKTDLTFDHNTILGVVESLPIRLNVGFAATGQDAGQLNSVVFYDFKTMKKIEVDNLYSTPISHRDVQVITTDEHQQLIQEYFAD